MEWQTYARDHFDPQRLSGAVANRPVSSMSLFIARERVGSRLAQLGTRRAPRPAGFNDGPGLATTHQARRVMTDPIHTNKLNGLPPGSGAFTDQEVHQ